MKKQYSLVELVDILTEHFGKSGEAFLSQLYGEGITSRLMHYIYLIHQLKNPNFGDLARELKVSKPTVTAAVEKLSLLGYIQKVQSDEDRRSFHLHCSEKGEQLVALHDSLHRENARFIEEALTPAEVDTLIALLNKVVQKV